MVHDARDTVMGAGTSVLDTIKANPIPAALIGVGLGWLIMNARSNNGSAERRMRRYRMAEGYGYVGGDGYAEAQETAREVGETMSHVARDAGHRVAEVAGDARVRGRRVVRGAGRQIKRAERGVESTLRENPLALGAVAIAIGAAIGLALPHTHVEDEWMGEAKERLLHRAEGAAGEVIQKAEETAGQLTAGGKSDQNGISERIAGSDGSKSQAV